MKKKIFLTLFYLIIFFSVLFPYELKDNIWKSIYILLGISLFLIIFKKKNMIILIILFVSIFIISTTILGNFIIDLIHKPTIPALDCEGALPMNGNWIWGYLFGILISIMMIWLYLLEIKKNVLHLERIFSLIIIIVIIFSIFSPNSFYNLFIYINQISKPTVIFPEGC